jgi:hypothetical protein
MSDKANASKSNRSYWDAISGASPIRKFWGRLVVVILFALPVIAYAATSMLAHVIRTLGMIKLEDPALASSLIYQLQSVGVLFLAVIIALCLLGMYFVFFVSVRVYGPQVALVQFIKQIQQGNFTPFRELRKDDQLKETWTALQDLATSLREKK